MNLHMLAGVVAYSECNGKPLELLKDKLEQCSVLIACKQIPGYIRSVCPKGGRAFTVPLRHCLDEVCKERLVSI